METIVKKWGIPLLGIILLSAFPAVFMYCNNAGEANISEAFQPLAVLCAIGLGMYFASWLFTRAPGKSALIAGLFMLAFSNFSLIEAGIKKIFPDLHYWHTLPIVLAVWLEIAFLIGWFLSEENGEMAASVMCLIFGGLTCVNIVVAIPGLLGKIEAERQLAAAQEERVQQSAIRSDLPNVYLLIFDEYANFPQMEEYYDYDNAVLKDFLEKHNFTISYDSHNESIMTNTIVTNLFNLDYVVDDTMSSSKNESIRKQGVLLSKMQEHGYDVQIIEGGNFLCDDSPASSGASSSATTAAGEDLAYLIYHKTAIYPFYLLNIAPNFTQVKRTVEYLSSDKIFQEQSTFTIGYVCCPHPPFCIDENGRSVSFSGYNNWEDNRYYLGQFKYVTKQIIIILENILRNDPDSIVILQSDHGARASSSEQFMEKFPLDVMNNPLNAVYYQGESIDEIRGLSSVNTMRVILSRLWNEMYELVEVPGDNLPK